MNAKEMLIIAAAVLILIALIASCFIAFKPTLDRVEWERQSYLVCKGDTLWAIAGRYCPDNVDRREWIDEVQRINRLDDANIRAGQRITVLVPCD